MQKQQLPLALGVAVRFTHQASLSAGLSHLGAAIRVTRLRIAASALNTAAVNRVN